MSTERINNSNRIKIIILLVTIALIVMMFPKGESIESEVFTGNVWTKDDLIASLTFEILKPAKQYNEERQNAANTVLPVFRKIEDVNTSVTDSVKIYNRILLRELNSAIISDNDNFVQETFLSNESFDQFRVLRSLENILSTNSSLSISDFFSVMDNIISNVYKKGYLDQSFNSILSDSIALRTGKYEREISKTLFFDESTVNQYIQNYLLNNFSRNEKLNNAATEYIKHFLQPNIEYSKHLTEISRELAMEKVPNNIGFVQKNERIVSKHEKISEDTKLKIDSYRIAKGDDTSLLDEILQKVGIVFHVILIFVIFVLYLYLFRKKIFYNNFMLLLISIILLVISFQAYLLNQIEVSAPLYLLVFVPSVSMLMTIIFDSRLGFYSTIVMSLIVGALNGNDYVIVLMNITAGALAAFTVRDIKNRNQIFRSFAFILLGYVTSVIAFGFEQFKSFDQILIQSAFVSSNALISPVLTYGLIIFFERIFKITTDLTLLELTDFNTPLLKNLAKVTPGTFTHSITIGSMVESAAEAIGANPILARVGSYYHDVGKTVEPEAFVENQMSNKNLHSELDPLKSASLIIDHVKRGIKLAQDQGLPKDIIDFIPMHHGTLVVKYFYEKQKELLGKENVDINDFRYPGPKPNTKETALVMLADACESAVRSMEELDETKLKNVVNNLIKQRVDDGQLDESPITMKDIKIIKETFHTILIGLHHRRIRYPKQDELENNSDDKNEE